MKIEIGYRPAQSLARVVLEPEESVVAESGAMVGMSTNVTIVTQTGGVMGGIKRLFGRESFFRNTFTAKGERGEVLLAHALAGDMVCLETGGAGLFMQSGAYIASSANVALETRAGGFRSFFAGEGIFVLKVSSQAPGTVLAGAFGGIEEIQCDGSLVIDTGHLVAWDAGLEYSVGKSAAGWIASWLSGEGLVCHFRGHGRIWIQSRNPGEYGAAVGALLPARTN